MRPRKPHRDDRLFQSADQLAAQRMRAHRVFRLSDPAILAIVVITLAIVAGWFW